MYNYLKKFINYLDNKKYEILKLITVFSIFFSKIYAVKFISLLFNLDISDDKTYYILALIVNIMVAIIFILIYLKDFYKEIKIWFKNIFKNIGYGFFLWLIGFILMVIVNLIIIIVFKGHAASNEVRVQEVIKLLPLVMLIEAGLLAPILEEILFRKTIYNVINNNIIRIFLAFLLFGGIHIINYVSKNNLIEILYIFPYGILGALFMVAYIKTKSIITPISMHMFHNTLSLIISFLIK